MAGNTMTLFWRYSAFPTALSTWSFSLSPTHSHCIGIWRRRKRRHPTLPLKMGTNKPLWERPSFFKVMLGDFAATLRIPPSFAKHLAHDLRGKSVLRDRRGAQWYAKIAMEDGHYFLTDGWESFVADHGIVFGDFLVLSYDGDLGFDVKIYGKSGCEKDDLLSADEIKEEPGNPSEENVSDCLNADRDKVSPRKRKRNTDFLQNKNNLCIVMKTKTIQNERVLRAACSLKTTNPCFAVTCRKARKCYMTIPSELAKKYDLSKKKSTILRDPSGKTWPVRITSRCDGRISLGAGWAFFCNKNCLKDGDVCVCEFVQGGNAIDVHIFRVEEYTKKSYPKSDGKRDMKGERKGEGREKEKKKRQSDAARPAQSGGNHLKQIAREGVLKAANSFITRHPKFVALWNLCRLYHMPIPRKVVEELGVKNDQKTTLFDPCGRTWQVDIICRPYGPYGQVELGRGWSKFVRGNQLAANDACVFEFLRGTDAIRVHVFRSAEFRSSAAGDIPEETDNKGSVILLG